MANNIQSVYNGDHELVYPKTVPEAIEGLSDFIQNEVSTLSNKINNLEVDTASLNGDAVSTASLIEELQNGKADAETVASTFSNYVSTASYGTLWDNKWNSLVGVLTSSITENNYQPFDNRYYSKSEVDSLIRANSGSGSATDYSSIINNALRAYTPTSSLNEIIVAQTASYLADHEYQNKSTIESNYFTDSTSGVYARLNKLETDLGNTLTASTIASTYATTEWTTSNFISNTEIENDYYNRTQTESLLTEAIEEEHATTEALVTDAVNVHRDELLLKSVESSTKLTIYIDAANGDNSTGTGEMATPYKTLTCAIAQAKHSGKSTVEFLFLTGGSLNLYDCEIDELNGVNYNFGNALVSANAPIINFISNNNSLYIANSTLYFTGVEVWFNGQRYDARGTTQYKIECDNSRVLIDNTNFYPKLVMQGGSLRLTNTNIMSYIEAYDAKIFASGTLKFIDYMTAFAFSALTFYNCQISLRSAIRLVGTDTYSAGLTIYDCILFTTSLVLSEETANLVDSNLTTNVVQNGFNMIITS